MTARASAEAHGSGRRGGVPFLWRAVLGGVFGSRALLVGAVGAASLAIAMAGLMAGVVRQADRDLDALMTTVGAGAHLVPDGSTGPFATPIAIDGDLIERAAARVAGDRPKRAGPVLAGWTVDGSGRPTLVVGRPPSRPPAVSLSSGRDAQRSGEVVIGSGGAVGGRVVVGGVALDVVGVTETSAPVAVVTLGEARRILHGGASLATSVALRDADVAADVAGLSLVRRPAVRADLQRDQADLRDLAATARSVGWLVAAAVIALTLAREHDRRRRDLAAMASFGASTFDLVFGTVIAGAAIGAVAGVVGVGLTAAIGPIAPSGIAFGLVGAIGLIGGGVLAGAVAAAPAAVTVIRTPADEVLDRG